jgi:hypothetical protein
MPKQPLLGRASIPSLSVSPLEEEALRELVRPIAYEQLESLHAIAVRLGQAVVDQIPELGLLGKDALVASAESGVRDILERILQGQDPSSFVVPPAASAIAKQLVHENLPLALLFRVSHLGHSYLLRDWLTAIQRQKNRAGDDLLLAATDICGRFLINWFTMLDYGWATEYGEERESWAGSVQVMRTETVHALLAGKGPDITEASKALRYVLDSIHTAFVVWLESETDLPHSEIDLRADLLHRGQIIAESFGADQYLVITLDHNAIGGWVATATSPPLRTIRSILKSEESSPFRAAIGSPHPGLEGFRRSYEEALEAQRVARLPGRTGTAVHEYHSLSMTALATADIARAREFVLQELGPLASQDDASLRITSTLRVYFSELCNASKTARRLGIHKNTVLYRIQQAELMLGHRLDERLVELQLALTLARTVAEDGESE